MKGEKTGGRQKGTPNKVKADMRKLFLEFAQDNFEEFQKAFDNIKDPEKKSKIYIDACKYVIPSLQAVAFNDISKKEKTIEDKLSELSKEAGKE